MLTNLLDSALSSEELLAKIAEAGFGYEQVGDYFYSLRDCWQRECGYCRLYDEGSPTLNMIFDAEPIEFAYDGKRWLIEFWKGQYGITTGAEIGVYRTDKPDIESERFTGTFYECPTDEELMQMSFTLKRKNKTLLQRAGNAWWLTGFKLGVFSKPEWLTMDIKITFPTTEMAVAFASALVGKGYSEKEYERDGTTVSVEFTKPKSEQSSIILKAQGIIAQAENQSNVKLYNVAVRPYTDTLDALAHIRAIAPKLFDFMLNSLYGHSFFQSFKWLLDLVYGDSDAQEEPDSPDTPEEPIAPELPVLPIVPDVPEIPIEPIEPILPIAPESPIVPVSPLAAKTQDIIINLPPAPIPNIVFVPAPPPTPINVTAPAAVPQTVNVTTPVATKAITATSTKVSTPTTQRVVTKVNPYVEARIAEYEALIAERTAQFEARKAALSAKSKTTKSASTATARTAQAITPSRRYACKNCC